MAIAARNGVISIYMHTYATEMLMAGVTFVGIMQLLGHSSAEMTIAYLKVRHPPQSGWLDELGRLKGGRAVGLGDARCAPY